MPTEKFVVNVGVRDLGPSTIAGSTLLVGSPSGKGGLFAIDTGTGKLKWSYRPVTSSGVVAVSTPPAVSGDVVIAAFSAGYGGVLTGVSLSTGRELWKTLSPAINAAPAVRGGMAYVMDSNGTFYAVDVATGKAKWTFVVNGQRADCVGWPVVRDEAVYLTGKVEEDRSDPKKPSGHFIFALDAATGREIWRHQPKGIYSRNGACTAQLVVTADTVYAAGETRFFGIDRATGRDRFPPAVVKQAAGSKEYVIDPLGLVDAGDVIVGMTHDYLLGFDKVTGRNVWEVPVKSPRSRRLSAVSGNVLYFHGSLSDDPKDLERGKLHALDLNTRQILWSFSRPTAEANWAFGNATPVAGGLWVDSYQAMVRLQ